MKTLYLILATTLTLLAATFIPSSSTTSLLPLPPNTIEFRHQADLVHQQRLHTFSQILGPGEFQPKPYTHRILPHEQPKRTPNQSN